MNRILSRTKVSDVAGRTIYGRLVHAGSIVETADGFEAVLIVDGYTSFRSPGHETETAAVVAIRDLWNPEWPDFLMHDGWIMEVPAPPKLLGATVEEVASSDGMVRSRRRSMGTTDYNITGESLAEVEAAIASVFETYHPSGYGTHFDEIELVDGVYRATGRRRNNCD